MKHPVKLAVLFLGAVILCWAAFCPANAGGGKVTEISCDSLAMMLKFDPNLILVDVREPQELTGPLGTIDGSINIPLKLLSIKGKELSTDKTLVFICRNHRRSKVAAWAMAAMGRDAY